MTRIAGYCPACGEQALRSESPLPKVMAERVVCAADGCPDPTAVHVLLSKRDPHRHLVKFTNDGYTVQHPIIERVRDGGLFSCPLDEEFKGLRGAPGVGLYAVPAGGTLADMEQVDEAETDFEMPDPAPRRDHVAPIGAILSFAADYPVPSEYMMLTGERQPIPGDAEHLLAAIRGGDVEWPFWLPDGQSDVPTTPALGEGKDMPGPTVEGVIYVMRVR